MTGSSMLMTIGKVLDLAQERGVFVTIAVHGAQYGFSGLVLSRDEQGVAMAVSDDLVVVRLSEITSVRLDAAKAGLRFAPVGTLEDVAS